MNNLQSAAVLISLHISKYDPFIFDRVVSDRVASEHAATKNAGRYRKYLFPDNCFPELNAVLRELNQLYAWHALNTLVWDGRGTRVLPMLSAEEHKAKTDAVIAKLPALLDAVEIGFPAAMERAHTKLNGMWKSRDYPVSGAKLRERFSVTAEYDAIPQLVTGMPASIQNMINSQIENRVSSAVENAMSDAWQRLYTCVEKFHERLATPGAVFRDSLVGNMRECCNILTRLNVTGNAELETMRAKVASDLAQYDPDTLRDNDRLRGNVAKTAENILATMRGTRRIVKLEDSEEMTA